MKANRSLRNPKLVSDDRAMLFNLLVAAGLSIVMLFAIFNIGTYINGTISSNLVESFGATPTKEEQSVIFSLGNISAGYDSTIDIMVVSTIIMAITLPLAAVVAVKKLF